MEKKKLIIITDGDHWAQQTIEAAGKRLGLTTVSATAGNPTPLPAAALRKAILEAKGEPVLVMVDDGGERKKGHGERLLENLLLDDGLTVLGVIAVAANTRQVAGAPVNFSITREGEIHRGPVDKDGRPEPEGRTKVEGDTVDVLNSLHPPLVVGIGDIGKMTPAARAEAGARITTRAIEEILKYHGLLAEAKA
ncbi:MAG: stage V sporulation protein AE [Firmicutes bacterium]|nr:stage V sporulation protein AE [Bacillota bacterium]